MLNYFLQGLLKYTSAETYKPQLNYILNQLGSIQIISLITTFCGGGREKGGKVSISSTFFARVFLTKVTFCRLFLVTRTYKNDVRTKNSRVLR